MKFSLIVYSAADAAGSTTALNFARAVLAQGHKLYRVFFYGDGVSNGAQPDASGSSAQVTLTHHWNSLAAQYAVDLVLCVTAAEQRGISAPAEGFQLSGLGQLVDAVANSDRCLTFR